MEILLLLIGAGVALVSSLLTLVLQHFLSLREDRIKRERERGDREAEQRREQLLVGAGQTASHIGDVAIREIVGDNLRVLIGDDARHIAVGKDVPCVIVYKESGEPEEQEELEKPSE